MNKIEQKQKFDKVFKDRSLLSFLSFLAFLPILIAPFLSVEVPRIFTYLPIVTIIFSIPFIWGNLLATTHSFKTYFIFIISIFCLILTHNIVIGDFNDAYSRLLKLSILFLFGSLFLISCYRNIHKYYQSYLNALILVCILSSFLIYFELKFDGPLYNFIRQGSDKSPFNPTVFNRSSVTICFLLMTAFVLIEKKKWFHYLSLILVIPMLIAGESQSAQLLMVFAPLFYFLFPSKYKISWVIVVLGITVVSVIKPFIVLHYYPDIPNLRELNYFLRHAAAGPRLEIWDFISRKALEQPWFGHGLEFSRHYQEFETLGKYNDYTTVMHPHSYILQLWIEFGIVGVMTFMAIITSLSVYFYKCLTGIIQKSAMTMLVSFLLVSIVSHGMWQSWWISLAFIITGLIIMADRYKKTYSNIVK